MHLCSQFTRALSYLFHSYFYLVFVIRSLCPKDSFISLDWKMLQDARFSVYGGWEMISRLNLQNPLIWGHILSWGMGIVFQIPIWSLPLMSQCSTCSLCNHVSKWDNYTLISLQNGMTFPWWSLALGHFKHQIIGVTFHLLSHRLSKLNPVFIRFKYFQLTRAYLHPS